MTVRLNPYLNFRDTARQAMEFYRDVFGGELEISTFADLHASEDPAEQNKVMHSVLTAPGGLVLMAADTPDAMTLTGGDSITVSVSGDQLDVLTGYWDKLADGGTVSMPFATAPWGDTFGMCVDRFGVRWMVNAAGS